MSGIIVALAIWLSPRAARGAEPQWVQVQVLSPADRASLVFEMTDAVAHVSHHDADATTVIVEAGPVSASVPSQDLIAPPAVPFIERVSVRSYRDANQQVFVRASIRLRAICRTTVRVAGRRIYVDAEGAGAPRARPSIGASAAPVPTDSIERKRPSVRGDAAAGDAVSVASSPESAYLALESDVLRRGRALVRRSDVKRLIALREEIVRRDERIGRKQPDVVARLLGEVDQWTDQARATRLRLDADALRQAAVPGRVPRD